MAWSSCPKCQNHNFELVEANITGAQFKMYFIQCTSCGVVVGTTNYYDSGVLAFQTNEKIEALERTMQKMENTLNRLLNQRIN